MDTNMFVEGNPKVMMGKPVIKGTRITVEMVLESLSAGESIENLLEAYPHLSMEAILAALSFAADEPKGES